MLKNLCTLLFLLAGLISHAQTSAFSDHVFIKISLYEEGNKTKASPMPQIKAESVLQKYKMRFDYLILNTPEIHQPGKFKERGKIFNLTDTSKMKMLYMKKLMNDKKFTRNFEEAISPITQPDFKISKTYTENELMEVASKFFYCDKVNPDTTVQSHVCISFNGVKETQWTKDYTQLAAFCFEAIFSDLDKDTSLISDTYLAEKKKSCEQYRKNITTLDKYLEDVKMELFRRMKNDATLKNSLLAYYEANKHNLVFKIIKAQ